jgi:tRNA(Arg) A34 adenosine deaminase TadA
MNRDWPQIFLGCLTLIVGAMVVFYLWFSLGWSESYDAQYKTVTYIAIGILIPFTILMGIIFLLPDKSDAQPPEPNQKDNHHSMNESDIKYIRLAIEVAQRAKDKGNHPFGSVLVDANGNLLLEAGNTVNTERDCTGHAETNLVRLASRHFDADFLATCTLYTSTEPCSMCSSAIVWSNIRRVVFGLSSKLFHEKMGIEVTLGLFSRELFATANRSIEVVGPLLEQEALKIHEGVWS